MITYFKNQKELAKAINESIDSYWDHRIPEAELEEYLTVLYQKNKEKFISEEGTLTSILRQRLGKKRLFVLIQILGIEEEMN